MIQRGPDNQKKIEIKTNKQNVLLLHSRLSIIDLKSRSNQPFSKHGLKLIFNGEIYNYLFLKDELNPFTSINFKKEKSKKKIPM